MGIFKFGKKKQTPEEKAEMLYTEGMTLIANGYWISAFDVIKQATDIGHRGAMGQLAMMYNLDGDVRRIGKPELNYSTNQ